MESFEEYLKLIIQVIFIVIIPAAAVYLWIKKKFTIGFTAGMIITSFLTGLIAANSVTEDPVKKFIRVINSDTTESAKSALKQVVQLGDEEFLRIDERKISDKHKFTEMKEVLASEYYSIAEKILTKNKISDKADCAALKDAEDSNDKLRHALRLCAFAETAGGKNSPLLKDITAALEDGEKRLADQKKKCTAAEK